MPDVYILSLNDVEVAVRGNATVDFSRSDGSPNISSRNAV